MKKFYTLFFAAIVAVAPMSAGAVTINELQAQLNALYAQLANLQQQKENPVDIETADASCIFNRNLTVGVRGSDVQCLQNYLIEEGYLKVSATGYFGSATRNALSDWQNKHDIYPSGYFGPVSRSSYQTLSANKPIVPPSETIVVAPPSNVYCAQVMKQCSDGSYVGYKPGTCEYNACPVVTVTPPVVAPVTPAAPVVVVPPLSYGALRTSAVMGSSANDVLRFRVVNDNVADVRISDVSITDSVTNNSGTRSSFTNFYLYESGVVVAGPLQMTMSSPTNGSLNFSLPNQTVVIPRNGSRDFVVRADVSSANSGGAVSGSVHTFGVSTVAARALPTGVIASVSMSSVLVLPITIHAADQAFVSSPIGATNNRVRTSVDDVAALTLAAEGSSSVEFSTLRLTLSGGALSGAPAFSVQLIDAGTNVGLGAATTQTCTPSGSSCTVLFSPAYTISAGTSKSVKVRLDSSSFANGAGSGDALSILIASTGDFTWSDGVSSGIEVSPTMVPFTVATVAYE